MSSPQKTFPEVNLSDPQYYFNRALSWLKFNNRVLQRAFDPRTPLLERLNAMAVFSANLDEFFMIRVAGLKQEVEANIHSRGADGLTPEAQLEAICQQLHPVVVEQHRYFEQELRPQLAAAGIHLLNFNELSLEQRTFLDHYFEAQIFPVLTPLAVDPSHPFPYISSRSLNLAVLIENTVTGEEHFARVKVPNLLPRFIPIPENGSQANPDLEWRGVPIEQVIAHNLESLFPGMTILAYHPFRITRSADLELAKEADDLLLAIEQELRRQRFGSTVRLEIQASAPIAIRQMLMRELALQQRDIYEVEGLLCLNDLMNLKELPFPHLKEPQWSPMVPPRLQELERQKVQAADIFTIIRQGDLLVHHPYESFTASVQRFITQAASDPDVLAIKMTLYRTSGDSAIVNALIAAAENGKQVAVLVELQARFDEHNNILWARKLEKVGVHVVYGLVNLKTHTKVALVVRREAAQICRYVHIGTGDYNSRTARYYTDLGLFSCRKDLGADLSDLFNYLTGYSRQRVYRKLLVAPVNLRDRLLALIHREIEHQHQGLPSRIVVKMNALTDPDIIVALYQASQAGVPVDLIVREMCCLRPGVPQVSDNIRVISIIGRFLEHSRIFYFHNRGEAEVWIGSIDWRSRNFDRRVEAMVPIEDPAIAQRLQEVLEIMLADNCQAWELQPDGQYIQRYPAPDEPERSSQNILMELALQ